jgi:hypothetical protein
MLKYRDIEREWGIHRFVEAMMKESKIQEEEFKKNLGKVQENV